MNSTTELFARTPSRNTTYLASWVGVGLILLAAGLNLAAAVLAEYAPGVVPASVLIRYEERKSALTLSLVAGGLVLVLRDAMATTAPQPARRPASTGSSQFVLKPIHGGMPLVTSQYLQAVGTVDDRQIA